MQPLAEATEIETAVSVVISNYFQILIFKLK